MKSPPERLDAAVASASAPCDACGEGPLRAVIMATRSRRQVCEAAAPLTDRLSAQALHQ